VFGLNKATSWIIQEEHFQWYKYRFELTHSDTQSSKFEVAVGYLPIGLWIKKAFIPGRKKTRTFTVVTCLGFHHDCIGLAERAIWDQSNNRAGELHHITQRRQRRRAL